MKKLQVTFGLLFLCLFVLSEVFSQKIYLAPDGSDSNPGTRESPMATLNAATEKAKALRNSNNQNKPIEVIALKGEYLMLSPLFLSVDDSGTADSPLIFKGEEGNKVVFRGGVELTGFEKINDRLWRVFVPQVAYYDSYFEQLYVNGRRAVRARTPNEGFYFVKKVTETILVKGEERVADFAIQKVSLDSADAACLKSFTATDFQDAVMTFYHNWDNTRKHIAGFDARDWSVHTIGKGMQPWNSIDNRSRYFIENFKTALDAPGEWFLDRSGYVYYIPQEGETIENTKFFAPIIKEFILIKGDSATGRLVENIRFENLTFEVAGYRIPPQGDEADQAAAPVDAVIMLDFANNISFQNCEVAHTGTYAFWMRRACSNCKISNCYIHDLGAGGIKLGETIIRPEVKEITNRIVIDNNIITDGGHVFPCAVGIIIFNASDNQLTHNDISDLRYSGISAGWVWGYTQSPTKRNKIEYNHIHHLGWGELCDMGGVYTLGASEGTTVSNNVIHHVYSFDYGGWGLYTDEGSFGITEENNLVYACKSSGFHQHYGKENIIRNNIFALNIKSQLQATRVEEHRSITFTNNIIYFDKGSLLSSNWSKFNLLSDYNCYWDTQTIDIRFENMSFREWQRSGKDKHSIIADPLFINPTAFDFHFKKTSVARKIKFVPFDYSMAGVYGSADWQKLAEINPKLARKFDEMVATRESVR